MATRFYLHATEPAGVTVTPDATWDDTASPRISRRIGPVKKTGDTLATTSGFTSTAGQDRLHYQGVSDPLPAGITFDTGVTWKCYVQVLESAVNDNITSRLGVRIVSKDGATVRHTVLAVADYSTATEWNTALRNKAFANGDAGTGSYVTVAGDRLVVEIGHNDNAGGTPGASISGSSRYGSSSTGADLAEDETTTTTTPVPWVECSATFGLGELTERFEVSPDNTALTISNTSATAIVTGVVSDSGITPPVGSFSALFAAVAQTRIIEFDWVTDTDWYCRFYFYMDTLPAANTAIAEFYADRSLGVRTGDLQVSTTGALRLRNQALVLQDTSATTLAVDTWHRIELHQTATRLEGRIFAGSNSGGLTPDEDESAWFGTIAITSTGTIRLGVINSQTWTILFDAFTYRTDTWAGPAILPLAGTLFQLAPTFNVGVVSQAAGTQDLAGSLFSKAATFSTGTITRGAVNLAGSLFQRSPTFNTGALTKLYPLSGVLFQRTPTFATGTITRGAVNLAGTVFTKAPTFSTGTVTRGAVNLAGVLFQRSPTFNTGTITRTTPLTGTLFQRSPAFNVGTVTRGAVNLAGALFTKAPTFQVGVVGRGAVNLSGVLFTKAPTFSTGAITALRNLAGTTFTKAPTFNTGAVTSTRNLAGVLFSKSPTFNVGTVTRGAVNLAGVLFQKAPSFVAGTITAGVGNLVGFLFSKAPTFNVGTVGRGAVNLAGTLFSKAPSFFTGAITAVRNLAGTVFVKSPSFPTGAVTSRKTLTGTTFTKAPSFATGTLTAGARNLAGVLFQKAPTFPQGAVARGAVSLVGTLFTKAPVFVAGSLVSVNPLHGVLFTKAPVFGVGTVASSYPLAGTLFVSVPVFGVGALLHQGSILGETFVISPTFFVGSIARVDYTPEWPVEVGNEWPVSSGAGWPGSTGNGWSASHGREWPVSVGNEWKQPPEA